MLNKVNTTKITTTITADEITDTVFSSFISSDDIAKDIIADTPTPAKQALAEIERIRGFWSSVVTDTEAPLTNRVKASELLYRSLTAEKESEPSATQTLTLDQKLSKVKSLLKKFSQVKATH